MNDKQPPIVQFIHITKRFPGVLALDDVNVDIQAGTCHGLVGENGAGKSTLAKILAGIHGPDAGEMNLNGGPVRFSNPRDALLSGIAIVHQELSFCENLSVAENLCLEALPHHGVWLAGREMADRAQALLSSLEAEIDVRRPVGTLTISEQQQIQIAAAVGRGARLILFDEPTSSLSQRETERLFHLIQRLKLQGITSIYVTHRLPEIFQLCDQVTVLRDGKAVATQPVASLDQDTLVQWMIGRRLEQYYPVHLQKPAGEEILRVESLSRPGRFEGLSFALHAGEVLGIAGLVGAGRSEMAQALFGLDAQVTGKVFLRKTPVKIQSPSQAIKQGLGLVPEDRKRFGLVLSMSLRGNTSLPILQRLSSLGWIREKEERKVVQNLVDQLHLRATGLDTITSSLSGGNQQKIALAKWLAARCDVLLLDEPTRGIDVGSKAELHTLIDQLANKGAAVLLISSELPEVINLSTRILVLREGRIVAEVPREKANQETLIRLMAGVTS